MNVAQIRRQQAQLAESNRHHPPQLARVPRDQWPASQHHPRMFAVWRSRGFLVQGFEEDDGIIRLSINRTQIDAKTGRWVDGITWDELQRLKAECGYGDRYAMEIFPADADVVNVANVRHLWLLTRPPAFAWRDA